MKLPYFIVIAAGFVCMLFAIRIPHLTALGIWLGFSTFFSLVFTIVAITLSIQDGIKAPPRDYSIPGTKSGKKFNAMGAVANLVFAFIPAMLPEIQATVRPPVVKNMIKAQYFQFTLGIIPMFAVIFSGYWAYGSSTSAYLLNSVKGPIWMRDTANVAAFLQSVIALHIFATPMFEFLDTKYGIKGSALKLQNLSFTITIRGGYLITTTLISAALPFIGDFISLTGSVSTIPLTFLLGNHMYLQANKENMNAVRKLWLSFNVFVFGCVSIASAVAALMLIVVDSKDYHLFADR